SLARGKGSDGRLQGAAHRKRERRPLGLADRGRGQDARVTLSCVVLAGGLGTRMRPLTETVPKALVPVAGRPFLDWQLRLLAEEGVRDVVLCVGYRGDMVRAFAGDGSAWGLRLRWVDEGRELLGTAGALRVALEAGRVGG